MERLLLEASQLKIVSRSARVTRCMRRVLSTFPATLQQRSVIAVNILNININEPNKILQWLNTVRHTFALVHKISQCRLVITVTAAHLAAMLLLVSFFIREMA